MQGYDAKDLGRSFRTVRGNTIQIAEDIPEAKYGFRAAEGTRTVAETLAHIASATRFPQRAHAERVSHMTYDTFRTAMADRAKYEAGLTTKSAIVNALRNEGEEFAAFMEGLSGSTLSETVSFPPGAEPPSKTRSKCCSPSRSTRCTTAPS